MFAKGIAKPGIFQQQICFGVRPPAFVLGGLTRCSGGGGVCWTTTAVAKIFDLSKIAEIH